MLIYNKKKNKTNKKNNKWVKKENLKKLTQMKVK